MNEEPAARRSRFFVCCRACDFVLCDNLSYFTTLELQISAGHDILGFRKTGIDLCV